MRHNLYSIPTQAHIHYDWSSDFQHANIHWRGSDVADLVCLGPIWYLIANTAFIRFRNESDARRHVQRTLDRVEQRLVDRQWAEIEERAA